MSRLDRLFTLLSTSTSASARNLAAKQLGEVQKTYPGELHTLLSRLHPLLRSKRWETRIAGSSAIAAILKELTPFRPNSVKEEDLKHNALEDVEGKQFPLSDIIGDGNVELNASEGQEFDSVDAASSEDQKRKLKAAMGLDVASKLGILNDEELVSTEDLQVDNLSAREKNVRRRQKRKQDKDKEECKRIKLVAAAVYSVTEVEKEDLNTLSWPLKLFCQALRRDLRSSAWEERHGSATALREIIQLQGDAAGMARGQTIETMQQEHVTWLDEMAHELLVVLARDRFGDFVSDQVVAPVRETCAMVLGNVMKLMNSKQMRNVIDVLLQLTEQSDWQCRHGAYLGLKYLLAGCNERLCRDSIVSVIYPKVFHGLKDVVDDVVSVAAGAFIPVVKQFVENIDICELSELLWNCLTDLDDLTGSTQSTMKLLSEIIKIKVPTNCGTSLHELIPRLFPFLHHSSSGVRKAALETLVSLAARQELAGKFLPGICGPLMSHLFQRGLLESKEDCLALIQTAWCHVCDNCPLAALLTATCPIYGQWFVLISKPHMWPLPKELLIQVKRGDQQYYLGGPLAQHSTDELERNINATKARCLCANLLGKLAGFIALPVPGFDYSKEPSTPVQMFAEKILVVNLKKSAFQNTAIGLVIMAWSNHHPEQVKEKAPDVLKSALWNYLSNSSQMDFDETSQTWQQLQTDASDLLATLKYHKMRILVGTDTIPAKPSMQNIGQLILHPLETDCKKNKIKPSRIETLLSRQSDIKVRFQRVESDIISLTTMTQSALAGALISLSFMPEKLNPVVKPLMESIKKEPIFQLQQLSAQKLVLLLDLCIQSHTPNPAEKVTRNLIHFAYADQLPPDLPGILSLKSEELPNMEPVQVRGTKEALKSIVVHFKEEITSKPPKFFERIVIPFQEDHLWRGLSYIELLQFLHALETVAVSFDSSLQRELIKTFDCLSNVLSQPKSSARHMAARCFASFASFLPNETISAVINLVIDKLENPNVFVRQGAIEAIGSIVSKLGVDFVPYIVLFIVPVLGRMSDQDQDVRQMATSMFATLIKLIPLDSSSSQNEQNGAAKQEGKFLPKHLLDLKLKQKLFIDELMSLKNVQGHELPVKVSAELRSYQLDGIKWLAFLNRYQLHGILCDDMGLGKTLQTICMLTSDHHSRSMKSDCSTCPSLVICPATLCHHWSSEVEKFVPNKKDLTPFVYNGSMAQRMALKKSLLHEMALAQQAANGNLVVVTSYDIVRSDVDFFNQYQWNYLVLDEGHAIRNAKTKTTLAIKSVRANHRLILSGTPIQNSVIELWSLFDFLMPGFLGTEKQFNTKYTKPIVGSRNSTGKSVSKESQEAGVLAMEALHRQVLPFILRRMKEDVLKDLPPKITQDYYCELSPIQKLLYEDFAKEQKDKTAKSNNDNKMHVFQALQYLRKVCNHPKLVLHEGHKQYGLVQKVLHESHSNLHSLTHASKLPALKQLLHECGIGQEGGEDVSVVGQHRALVFCQLKAMMDIVETDLLKISMPSVTYLRLDGSIPPSDRHGIVTKFNNDVSIDLLLLTTSVGGLGLNLTGADTVIFVEHDWNPMKDLQAMDRAHRIGQKKVVNVYRLITRNTVEEKILGLQKFKLKTANSVITRDNSSLSSMATDQLFDLFSLEEQLHQNSSQEDVKTSKGVKALLENLPELWDDSQYDAEYDMESYSKIK